MCMCVIFFNIFIAVLEDETVITNIKKKSYEKDYFKRSIFLDLLFWSKF